jgi:hypothetical protein
MKSWGWLLRHFRRGLRFCAKALGRMNSCNHPDLSGCGMSCNCACQTCLIFYVEAWDKMVAELNLCHSCGVPKDLTPESLIAHQHVHFFDPCEACAKAFHVCVAMANLCETCHSHIDSCKCDYSE